MYQTCNLLAVVIVFVFKVSEIHLSTTMTGKSSEFVHVAAMSHRKTTIKFITDLENRSEIDKNATRFLNLSSSIYLKLVQLGNSNFVC